MVGSVYLKVLYDQVRRNILNGERNLNVRLFSLSQMWPGLHE